MQVKVRRVRVLEVLVKEVVSEEMSRQEILEDREGQRCQHSTTSRDCVILIYATTQNQKKLGRYGK